MSTDNVCKLLAEKYPDDFARWLLAVESPVKVLKTELSIEAIRADSVTFLQTKNRILHIEFQTLTKSTPPIPLRMLDYFVRLVRQYDVPITQVVIFLQETSNEIAFTEEYVNEMTSHRYRVIRMWEQDSTMFLNNPALLPLAPLTRTDSPERLLSQVAQSVAKISSRESRQEIAAYTEILAGLKFEKDLIRRFLSEDIMRESVIYQDIEKKGENKGEQKEALSLSMLLLNQRFGELESSIVEKVEVLSVEKLEALCVALLNISEMDDLIAWLEENGTP
ncbi:MAG: Rpn family recombination-promoting nuclease/putative transposase [Calothrix sp. MO_167.B12]|nr:Rpn family recombination-promoting nuclease/putative transposase [Calothrix sp. MO_167.B12]